MSRVSRHRIESITYYGQFLSGRDSKLCGVFREVVTVGPFGRRGLVFENCTANGWKPDNRLRDDVREPNVHEIDETTALAAAARIQGLADEETATRGDDEMPAFLRRLYRGNMASANDQK